MKWQVQNSEVRNFFSFNTFKTSVFNTNNNKKLSLEQMIIRFCFLNNHVTMKNGVMAAENSRFAITGIYDNLKYIKIESCCKILRACSALLII